MPTHLIGTDAFQECDTVGITRACTKHNYLVKTCRRLPHVMHEAFQIATAGRPGPVVDRHPQGRPVRQRRLRRARRGASSHDYQPRTKGDPGAFAEAAALIAAAKRPLLYTGGGVINAGPRAPAAPRARRPDRRAGHLDADGPGRLSRRSDRWLGMVGMHGAFEANHAMHDCDVMVASARASTTASPAGSTPSRPVEEDPHRHRPLVDQQVVRADSASSATRRHARRS